MTTTPFPRVPTRRFGRTELQMPVLSCGGMRYQQAWKDVPWSEVEPAGQTNLEDTIRRSIDLGIPHIETARGYGSSEMQLGRLLPQLPREKLIVQTKVAPSGDPQEFLDTFEKSMAYLQLEYVDLLALHGINHRELLEQSIGRGKCLEAALRLKKEGRVRHVGFSTHAPCDVILDAIADGGFDYVNLHWYYINQRNWPAIEAAVQQDMGVFIISPTDKGGKLYAPSEKLLALCAPFSPMAFNDLFCLARPEVHTLSIGAARPSDFDAHVAALADYEHAELAIAPVTARLEAELEGVAGPEWLAMVRGPLPEWEAVPGGVNLQVILLLWTLVKAFDLHDYCRMRYNLLGNAGHWFPGAKYEPANRAELRAFLADQPLGDAMFAAVEEADAWLRGEEVKRLSKSED